ncbi:MAG: hypothetical protein B7Y87_03475 [Sphingomonadales bacterium 32-64-22]|nr:MAG: hypothetical protein B7Y87_03475 [Sphingomonadales bacterium 32-64-22]
MRTKSRIVRAQARLPIDQQAHPQARLRTRRAPGNGLSPAGNQREFEAHGRSGGQNPADRFRLGSGTGERQVQPPHGIGPCGGALTMRQACRIEGPGCLPVSHGLHVPFHSGPFIRDR